MLVSLDRMTREHDVNLTIALCCTQSSAQEVQSSGAITSTQTMLCLQFRCTAPTN